MVVVSFDTNCSKAVLYSDVKDDTPSTTLSISPTVPEDAAEILIAKIGLFGLHELASSEEASA